MALSPGRHMHVLASVPLCAPHPSRLVSSSLAAHLQVCVSTEVQQVYLPLLHGSIAAGGVLQDEAGREVPACVQRSPVCRHCMVCWRSSDKQLTAWNQTATQTVNPPQHQFLELWCTHAAAWAHCGWLLCCCWAGALSQQALGSQQSVHMYYQHTQVMVTCPHGPDGPHRRQEGKTRAPTLHACCVGAVLQC